MSSRYKVVKYSAPGELIGRIAGLPQSSIPSAFQSPAWLNAACESLAPAQHARILGIELRDATTDELSMLLPLAIAREGGLSIAEFIDFGVSDYKAPILGPAAPATVEDARAAIKTISTSIEGADLLRLSSMLADCGGRPNPLVLSQRTQNARLQGNQLTIEGTYEAYLRARGKKYRTDVERCFRHLEKAGNVEFKRAGTHQEKLATFKLLEEQQLRRRQELGGDYVLDRPHYSAFYRSLLTDGDGVAEIYALSAAGEPVATLYALVHNGVVTVPRFATGDKRWSNIAPGRLILMATMRHYLSQGIRTFDFGIGTYPFKEGFGFELYGLHDLLVPLTWRALPSIGLAKVKARLRDKPYVRSAADKARALGYLPWIWG